MVDQNQQRSEQTEHAFRVGQVTSMQASWQEQERGEQGLFTPQLILGNGVEEYILEPDAEDLKPRLKLFATSKHTAFDIGPKVLMLSNLCIE